MKFKVFRWNGSQATDQKQSETDRKRDKAKIMLGKYNYMDYSGN